MTFNFKQMLRENIQYTRRFLWENFNGESLIQEVSIKDLRQKYPQHSDVIDKVIPLVANKYLPFILNNVKTGKDGNYENLQSLVQLVQKFDKALELKKIDSFLKQNPDTDQKVKNIDNWKDPNELENFLKNLDQVKTKSEVKKDTKLKDADRIYEDETYVVIHPKTEKASCYYGSETKWCVSAKEGNRFDHYKQDGQSLFFVINKSEKSNNKIAIVINITGRVDSIWTTDNSQIEEKQASTLIGKSYNMIKEAILEFWRDRIKEHLPFENINWDEFIAEHPIAEDFIAENRESINWDLVSYYQGLSVEFIEEYNEYINMDYLQENDKIPDKVKAKFKRKGKF